ncbi:SDR family oxidoreductase [Lacihabitans sp. CCS-44]|uniref:SDR family oxidoreductase n=1 Tax=Lacihabitans sp. CCS-44 TaxID=2487331 RepID=UPI0020CC951F|nr:SDR family oxidoreductase [Lacihabitans sp. CCS-44]MCP9756065.1 SDR family oxidoreductase [Lacihabitans sp. CCS-44]
MNKIALVTGGSRGLGKDMAISLAKKNIDIILTYHSNQTDAEDVVAAIEANGQKAVALKFDVADIKSFGTFLEQVSAVLQSKWQTSTFDFLINNAGIGATIPIADMTEEVFDNFVNIHFKGVYFLTQKALSMMNDGGGIVFISSGTTRVTIPGYSIYSSLKSAVETFTKVVAKEYGNRGIRSNIVAPGPIETDFNDAAIRNNPQMKGFLASQTALGRVGSADDIGSVVAFLCTEDSKWINGQKIEVSGGFFL